MNRVVNIDLNMILVVGEGYLLNDTCELEIIGGKIQNLIKMAYHSFENMDKNDFTLYLKTNHSSFVLCCFHEAWTWREK